MGRMVRKNGKPTLENWLEWGRILEKQTRNRISEIKGGDNYKEKNPKCLKRDKILASLVKQNKAIKQ